MSWYQILILYVIETGPEETPEISTFYYKSDKTLDKLMDDGIFVNIVDKARERIESEKENIFIHAIITKFPIDTILKSEYNGTLLNPDGTFLAKIEDEGE